MMALRVLARGPGGSRALSTTILRSSAPGRPTTDTQSYPSGPTHSSRISPRQPGQPEHPGYTRGDEPPSSKPPTEMSAPSSAARPASLHTNASTKAAPPHPEVHEMAKGGETHGSDAITPEERSQKVWGPNSRSQQFNKFEMKRQPVLDGTSHTAGFDKKGKSKT